MIAFYGASVTQQKSGYAVKLKSRLQDEVEIFGYGGMHLNNAGICYIDKVLEVKPDYCFIDWFSTTYLDRNQSTIDYLDTLVDKFSKIDCKLIFLFLLNRNHDERVEFYEYCKAYLRSKGLPFYDMNEHLESSPEMLRDFVHTTEVGSEKYAEIIHRKFDQDRPTLKVVHETRETGYSKIRETTVNRIYTKQLKLNGKAEVIGLLLTIGRHSGVVRVEDQNGRMAVNTWDQWCHYDRMHFNIPLKIQGTTELKIGRDVFDTSSCNIEGVDFQRYKKKLILHSIYYIGELELVEGVMSTYRAQFLYWSWEKAKLLRTYRKLLTSKVRSSIGLKSKRQ